MKGHKRSNKLYVLHDSTITSKATAIGPAVSNGVIVVGKVMIIL